MTSQTPGTLKALTSLEQARRTAALAAEKLAENVVILDMRPACVYTDYFVIATGRNPRQTKAIFDEVYAQLKSEARLTPRATDGAQEGNWIIADYLDVDVNIIRIVFAVLTFIGGAGVPLYLAGWLLIPEEGSDRSLAADIVDSLSRSLSARSR